MSQTERAVHDLDTHAMPLTQVSIEYGPQGLEFRLQRALDSVALNESGVRLVQDSISLGLDLHRDDARTYEPYASHLLRVALRLIEDLDVRDPVTIAAAMLHDSIEDHPDELARRYFDGEIPEDPWEVRRLGYEALRMFAQQRQGEDLADVVLAVSNPIVESQDLKVRSYVDHVRQLMLLGPTRPKIIKIADVLDNVDVPKGIENVTKRRKLDQKQIYIYEPVETGLREVETGMGERARSDNIALLSLRRKEAVQRLHDEEGFQQAS